ITSLESHGLYRLEIVFAVVYEGWRSATQSIQRWFTDPVAALRTTFLPVRRIEVLENDLFRARQELATKVGHFAAQLRDFIPIAVLDKSESFRFLRGLLNYAPQKVEGVKLAYDHDVDFQVCGSVLECHRDHLRLDNEFVRILTLKDPSAQTHAHLLKGLAELPAQFIAATEWKRVGHRAVRRRIQSERRHFHNSKVSLINYVGSSRASPKDMLIDDSAAALVSELGAALEEIEVRGAFFGEFSLSLILHDADPTKLKRAVSEGFKMF